MITDARCYKADKKLADIDLNTLLIEIQANPDVKYLDFFNSIEKGTLLELYLDILNSDNINLPLFINTAKFESILVHEKTHFLDFTSTVYGLIYTGMKTQAAKVLSTSNDFMSTSQYKVFSDIVAEIQPLAKHNSISESYVMTYDSVLSYGFYIRHDEQFGFYIQFHLTLDNDEFIDIPLSMLSLLEARAFANEYLSLFDKAKLFKAKRLRSKYLNTVESFFRTEMGDVSLSEYNILLKFIIYDFEVIDISKQYSLRFFCAMSGYVLNMSIFEMASLAPIIHALLGRSKNRENLIMDLHRGSNRQIILFLLNSYISNFIKSGSNRKKAKELKRKIKTNPLGAVHYLIEEILGYSYFLFRHAFEYYLQNIPTDFPGVGKEIILSKAIENYDLYTFNHYRSNLDDFYFIDDFRSTNYSYDVETISYKKRINLDILEYFDNQSQYFSKLSENKYIYGGRAQRIYCFADDKNVYDPGMPSIYDHSLSSHSKQVNHMNEKQFISAKKSLLTVAINTIYNKLGYFS